MADRDLHTILSFDAGSASGFATDPFGAEPLPFGCQMGTVSEPVVRIEEHDGFVHVSDGNPDSEGFALPGIFQPNLDGDDVCIPIAGSELCFRDIDTSDESSLPLIAEGYDPFSEILHPYSDEEKDLSTILGGAPSTSMPDSLSQSFADYYFMKEAVGDVIDGKRTLTLEEEAYLRMHAAAILEEMSMDADSTLFPHESYFDHAANIYSSDNPFDIDVPIFAGSDYTLTFNPSSGTEIVDCAYDGPGKIAPYEYLSEITLDDALKIELLHAKEKVMEEMEALDRTSYYDHSEEIEDLASIEDADELAHAIEAMLPKVSRGQKLKDLRDIAWEVGGSATIGDEEINLQTEIYELSLVEDEEQFALGALEVLDKVKVVSLANGLDALVEMGNEMIAHVDEILVGIPRDDDAYSHCSQAMHGRSGCNIGVQLLAGTENSAEYERYFKALKETAIVIRDTLDGGDYDRAMAEYTSLVNQDRFQNVISHLEGDLEMTQTFKFGAKIGIIVAAMAIANVAGIYAGAGIAALGAPAWAVGGGELAAGSLAFVSANRGLNTLLLGEDFFDPNLSPGGNALQFMEEWAMTALMFKFLRLGMNSYSNVVRSVLMRRAGSALLQEGVITEAELAGMGAETMQKVALRAELGLMGRVLNHGGLFATEYVAFTAWDYLRMTYEASKEAGALALPEDFFTSESLAERFVFLACLKVGGALATPFTAPLQAKVSSSLMKRYGPRLRQYDADYREIRERFEAYDGKNPAELDAIFTEMTALLKKRHALETAMSRVDPDLIKSSAQTKAVLDNVKSIQDQAVLLEVLSIGSYGEVGKARTIRLLKAGRKQGALDYSLEKSGDIVVKLTTVKGVETIHLTRERPEEVAKGAPGGDARDAEWIWKEENLRANLTDWSIMDKVGESQVQRILDMLDSEGGLGPKNANKFKDALAEMDLHFGRMIKERNTSDFTREEAVELAYAEQMQMRTKRLLLALETRRPNWPVEEWNAVVHILKKAGLTDGNLDTVRKLLKPLGLKIPPANTIEKAPPEPKFRNWAALNYRFSRNERSRVQTLDPRELRFSQLCIKSLIGPQEQIMVYGGLRILNVVEAPNGSLISYDNARLTYSWLADLPSVEVVIRGWNEFIPDGIKPAFMTEYEMGKINEYRSNNGLDPITPESRAHTWGEAMEWRLLIGGLSMSGTDVIPVVNDTAIEPVTRQ